MADPSAFPPDQSSGPRPPLTAGVRSCAPLAILLLMAVLLAGCSSLPFAPSQPQNPPQVEQEAEHAGPLSTAGAVWWMGLACAAVGTVLTVAWMASWKIPILVSAPSGSGVAALAVGIANMTLAELMARYFWIAILIMLAVFGLGIFEYLMKRRWFRKWMNISPDSQDTS